MRVPPTARLEWPCGCHTRGPDHQLAALHAALIALQANVASDCPHCSGEGSWTDDEPPRMIPVRHMTDCPVTLAQAALRAAGHAEAAPCR